MQNQVLYNKRTGQPVQIIARARTKPIMQDVVCYQELEPPYEYYVMEKVDFFEVYTRSFEELPRKRQKYLEKKQDLPDKQPRISKGEVLTRTEEEEVEPVDEKMRKNHIARVGKGKCDSKLTIPFNDVLHNIDRIGNSCVNLVEVAKENVTMQAFFAED